MEEQFYFSTNDKFVRDFVDVAAKNPTHKLHRTNCPQRSAVPKNVSLKNCWVVKTEGILFHGKGQVFLRYRVTAAPPLCPSPRKLLVAANESRTFVFFSMIISLPPPRPSEFSHFPIEASRRRDGLDYCLDPSYVPTKRS